MQAQEEQGSRLKPLGLLYGQYIGRNRGRPPTDEAAFRAFIEENGSSMMQTYNVSSVDDLFVSERDGQPFEIVYGSGAKPSAGGRPVVAYEQQGVEGKIMVANDLGDVWEVPAAELVK